MAAKHVFAHTPTNFPSYPPFVNIRREDGGRHLLTVREAGHDGLRVAQMELSPEELEAMAAAIMDHLHGGQ